MKPERTASERLAIRQTGALSPDSVILKAVLKLLQQKAKQHENTAEADGYLVAAARYVAGAITVYAESSSAGLPDAKYDQEEALRFKEGQAAKLLNFAREMEAIMSHPACAYLAMLPADEQALRGLLQKLISDHESRTPAAEAIAIRDAARARLGTPAKGGKGTPQGNRARLCHSFEHAWFIATGQESPPGRKLTKEQGHYGEFVDYIRALLSLSSATAHIDADGLHRDILNMGK